MKKMKEIGLPIAAVSNSEYQQTNICSRQKKRWTIAACFFSVGGFFCAFSGMFLSILLYFEAFEFRQTNSRISGLLFLSAFALFVFAAHALDKIDVYKKAERAENRRILK